MRSAGGFVTTILVVLLLRSTALSALAARGLPLDALAFATLIWALKGAEGRGATMGFVLGLIADLDAAHWLGRHALVLSVLGYAIGRLSGTLVRESARTQLVLLAIMTAIHQTWVVAFEIGAPAGWPYLLERVVLGSVATALIGALLLIGARRLSGHPLFGHVDLASGASS